MTNDNFDVFQVTCDAQKAWGWTYMSISRYEGDDDFSLEFLGKILGSLPLSIYFHLLATNIVFVLRIS